MVPKIVLLDALPMTVNGKIDCRALGMTGIADEGLRAFEAPADDLEMTISDILGEVVGVERVSAAQNFADLGANSRHMVEFVGKLRQALQVDVRITDAYQHLTVRALAAHLRGAVAGGGATQLGKDCAAARRATKRPRKP